MTTEEQNLSVEEKKPVAGGDSIGAGCCGCKPDEANEGALLEAQAPDPAGEKSEPGDGDGDPDAATSGPCPSPAGFADSMYRRFATGVSGKASGPFAALADCQRMLERCMPGAAPAETNEPSPATVTAGSITTEV